MSKGVLEPRTDDLFEGGGEMGALMRAMDWSKTPLGFPDHWDQGLKNAVRMLLPSKAQICMFWGSEFTILYNDAYRPVLATKHPHFFATPGAVCWSEVWEDLLGPLLKEVIATAEAYWAQDRLFLLNRNGFLEETYFDVSYDPIRDDMGSVGGVFCIVSETTGRVLGERRLKTLRDLGEHASEGKTAEEACRVAVETIAKTPADIPFAAIYLLDAEGQSAHLVSSVGIEAGAPAAPLRIDLGGGEDSGWSLTEALETGRPVPVMDLAARFDVLPQGPWPEPPHTAFVLPIIPSGALQPTGFLIAGASARLLLDDAYRGYFDLVAGHIATAVGNARAYEEERRRAEALTELDRAKTEFFSNISHEFRTPLTLMLNPIHDLLVGQEGALTERQLEMLDIAHRNSLRLLKLVNMLLDFSRIQAGRATASFEPTDLAVLTTELTSMFRSAVEHAGLRLVVDCPPLSEPIYVDHDMWEKIILNLLSNAFKFTFEGEIAVSLHEAADHVMLSVGDTGVGIAPHDLTAIFERFRRVRGARARTFEGSGIGLSLVQELVHSHGGSIGVESEPGVGSVFRITIPKGSAHLPADQINTSSGLASTSVGADAYVAEAMRWLPEEAAELEVEGEDDTFLQMMASETAGARVLIADDNADMRDYLQRLLKPYYDVQIATNGRAALDLIMESLPDLVLADIMMPVLDGLGLLHLIRANAATSLLPVVLLSARAGEEARVEGLQAGADAYLVKPFSARELLATVDAHVKIARIRQQLLKTEQEARRQAEEANEMKMRFLGMISHELRTPLASIKGFASTLLADDVEFAPSDQQSFLAIIDGEADNLTKLIDDLLDLTRLNSGQLGISPHPDYLAALFDAARYQLETLARTHQLHINLPDDLPPVRVDSARIQQVIANLVDNAVKYSPEGGDITIEAHATGDRVRIDVRDGGIGIAPSLRDAVFEAFLQLGSGKKGVGLGLAICKALVEAHGGRIWIQDSEAPGTTVSFTLLVAPVPTAP